MKRYIIRLLALLMLATSLSASGCYRMIFKRPKREAKWEKQMGKGPDGADAALRLARSLVKTPTTKKQEKHYQYRRMAIRSITAYMEVHGFDEALDAEAHRYYEEMLTLGDPAEARRELARLYEHTGRQGKSAQLLAEDVPPSGATPQDEYVRAIATWRQQLAKGDIATSELAWARAEELFPTVYPVHVLEGKCAPGTKVLGCELDATGGLGAGRFYNIDATTDWTSRQKVLLERMTSIASPHDSPTGRVETAEIARLWKQYEGIGVRTTQGMVGGKSGEVYRVYLDGARVFATAGQHEVAAKLHELGKRAATGEVSGFRRADLACGEAFIATRALQANAPELAAKCIELADARSKRELDIGELTVLAGAFERAGNLGEAEKIYQDAIVRAERQRDSFPVEERTQFFRTSVRRAYWGLARTLARRSQSGRGEASKRDFLGALQATESVRARQLGELLASSGQRLGKLESLSALRERLRKDDIVLDYVAMDDEVLLLAITRDAHAVRFIPLDSASVGFNATAIADGLSTSQSSADALDHALTLLGRALILPVSQLVKGKRRFIVLPDGALNSVPFDLLDLETDGYRPLLESADVEITPSLAFFLAPETEAAKAGLFGMADPTYGSLPEVAIADEASRAAARAASGSYFEALPETRRELEAIARTLGGKNLLIYGADARESTLKGTPLEQYAIVHFATHGILGRDVPGIDEPALVLAGEAGEDGFLTATEASALKLDARLTVLSACKTGAGDSGSGEGVLGMSRAFMVAGSRSVLVSLWSVDSLATEALMVEFYRRMHAGEPPATALRAAKLAVRDGTAIDPESATAAARRRDHPYYWGAFILVGR